jgi:hypothetical protein
MKPTRQQLNSFLKKIEKQGGQLTREDMENVSEWSKAINEQWPDEFDTIEFLEAKSE